MRTTLLYYFDKWRGPIISNNESNKMIYALIDGLGYKSDMEFFNWYWPTAMADL